MKFKNVNREFDIFLRTKAYPLRFARVSLQKI